MEAQGTTKPTASRCRACAVTLRVRGISAAAQRPVVPVWPHIQMDTYLKNLLDNVALLAVLQRAHDPDQLRMRVSRPCPNAAMAAQRCRSTSMACFQRTPGDVGPIIPRA